MKSLRGIHFVFGVLALILLLWIATAIVLPPFQEAERSRIEEMRQELQQKLGAYHEAKGHYPDSTDSLPFTNSRQGTRSQPKLREVKYRRADAGYELSYAGRWYNYTLSVSSNGASSIERMTAR